MNHLIFVSHERPLTILGSETTSDWLACVLHLLPEKIIIEIFKTYAVLEISLLALTRSKTL